MAYNLGDYNRPDEAARRLARTVGLTAGEVTVNAEDVRVLILAWEDQVAAVETLDALDDNKETLETHLSDAKEALDELALMADKHTADHIDAAAESLAAAKSILDPWLSL